MTTDLTMRKILVVYLQPLHFSAVLGSGFCPAAIAACIVIPARRRQVRRYYKNQTQ